MANNIDASVFPEPVGAVRLNRPGFDSAATRQALQQGRRSHSIAPAKIGKPRMMTCDDECEWQGASGTLCDRVSRTCTTVFDRNSFSPQTPLELGLIFANVMPKAREVGPVLGR